ncbi:hypothetical protein D6D08_10376 [Aureobasidium pullulans]|nr:hypothetical protein D6D08_10376 [Aureobasidium pullulans]
MRSVIPVLATLSAFTSAQSTSIDIDAISVATPTTVFALPVVYVTQEGGPAVTATTLGSTAVGVSDPLATDVFDSAADASAAIVSAMASSIDLIKRDSTCVPQPTGISYNSSPDTAAAFATDKYYMDQSLSAQTPSGYSVTFQNLIASNSADNYMGFTLLSSYDASACAGSCSAITGCNSVNIYFERDPSLNPDASGCPNPPSTINIKCVFWGGAATAANANNFGQWRDNFQVLIAGSNGYINSTYAAKLVGDSSASSSSLTATSTSVSSTFTTVVVPASTTSTTILSSSTTSSSGSSSTLSASFYITIGDGRYVAVGGGQSGAVSYVSSANSATKFQLDKNTGYLVEASGTIGYAASLFTSSSNAQKVYFSSVGQPSIKYLTCNKQTTTSSLQCTADTNNKLQVAQTCSTDSSSSLWFASSVDKGCSSVTLTYIPT